MQMNTSVLWIINMVLSELANHLGIKTGNSGTWMFDLSRKLVDQEGCRLEPTVHPKIKVAAVREYPYKLALQNEIELYNLSTTFDDMAIVKKMKEIVPEYRSNQSKYKILDR